MASIFEAVKATVPVRAAAERYGLEVNLGGMVRCPFHEDRTPSMKLYEDHYFCFGCGKHGDVINLVAELFQSHPTTQPASWRAISVWTQALRLFISQPGRSCESFGKTSSAVSVCSVHICGC